MAHSTSVYIYGAQTQESWSTLTKEQVAFLKFVGTAVVIKLERLHLMELFLFLNKVGLGKLHTVCFVSFYRYFEINFITGFSSKV